MLVELDEAGVRGVNLLEFCYPFRNWNEFSRRGYRVKNPPFEVLTSTATQADCLSLEARRRALSSFCSRWDEGLRIGVQYCSLDNKNRDQVLQANRSVALDPALYELGGDCFYMQRRRSTETSGRAACAERAACLLH